MLIPIFRDDTKNKLADKLFEHSATRDQLLMMPSVSLTIIIVWLIRRTNIAIFQKYTDLQSDLEFRVNELQEALGDLEKVNTQFVRFAYTATDTVYTGQQGRR